MDMEVWNSCIYGSMDAQTWIKCSRNGDVVSQLHMQLCTTAVSEVHGAVPGTEMGSVRTSSRAPPTTCPWWRQHQYSANHEPSPQYSAVPTWSLSTASLGRCRCAPSCSRICVAALDMKGDGDEPSSTSLHLTFANQA